ncbi:MAG TPA: ATP-binding protein [Flavipsychrobacter sp.]|nr:ATP-binding protein [Flavipsychrobacter sp.]
MDTIRFSKIKKRDQYWLSLAAIALCSVIGYLLSSVVGYRVIGYTFLISVSLLAMVFDILPVLLAALLSALIWDFFFIPPYFTFQIGKAEDAILLLMYFVIAMVNAALTHKIRKMEKAAILKEEKENTVKLYNTLLNSLSHELRTPIAAIIGATDNLQNGSSKLTLQHRHDLVSEISKASFRLNQQVENLLNMSRLESGYIQPRKDWCDINEIIYRTVKRIEENKISQKISININPDLPLFKTDQGMLEQILYNILNNASLYTPPQSLIDIVAMYHADVLEITIEDNGPGFPKEEIAAVFNKFYRLKSAKAGGTGLGLSIVKGFTEALGGTVDLVNIPTGGARFTVTIPAETSYLKNMKNE